MCREIAQAGNGMYVRVDNTNNAEKALNAEINKLAKADVETQVFTEFDEQFQVLAWLALLLLAAELMILNRKNPLFKNVNSLNEIEYEANKMDVTDMCLFRDSSLWSEDGS